MKKKAGRVSNKNGDAFEIVVKTGGEFGTTVEVYDVKYPHCEFGQFVSDYALESFLKPAPGGLDLAGGVNRWTLDGPAMRHAQRLAVFAAAA